MSLTNERAKTFKECLEKYQKKIQGISFEIAQVNTDYFSLLHSRDEPKNNNLWKYGKLWIDKISDQTRNWITSRIYFSTTYETDLITGSMIIVFYEISNNILKLLNLHPTMSGKLKGFEVFDCVQPENWSGYWTKRFECCSDDWFTEEFQKQVDDHGIEPPEQASINEVKFISDDKIYKSRSSVVYTEKYIENFKLYTKTFSVFF